MIEYQMQPRGGGGGPFRGLRRPTWNISIFFMRCFPGFVQACVRLGVDRLDKRIQLIEYFFSCLGHPEDAWTNERPHPNFVWKASP
ncbi:hypothetical protein FHS27_001630 [Rhodopirellula rubra]|uniref:Uncharacterized protein n=1 Tax=Aporhodopirellula rubra TaxID=980271 RepID=A0A7W5DWJ2_9BACT|nr:hypothetical protein [Aporhodopirellula rubra]